MTAGSGHMARLRSQRRHNLKQRKDKMTWTFRDQIEFATRIVAAWPAWKRGILAHSLEPQNKAPRESVDNNDVRENRAQGNPLQLGIQRGGNDVKTG